MTRRIITHEHLHKHLLEIQKDQEAQSALLAQLKHEQDAQGLLLRRTFRKVGKLMSVADDIKAALAEVSAATTAETDLITAIDTKITGLNDAIVALQQQVADLIAGGSGATAQELLEIKDSVAALKTGTDAVKAHLEITANTTPAP